MDYDSSLPECTARSRRTSRTRQGDPFALHREKKA
jgi:hypothetical protein